MIINVTEKENNTVVIAPAGNLDYITSEELDAAIRSAADKADRMLIDLSEINYIASAGLRVLLNADEMMSEKKGMVLTNANDYVMGILKMTDFIDVLTVQQYPPR